MRYLALVMMIVAALGLSGCAANRPGPAADAGMEEGTTLYGGLLGFYRGPLNHLNGVRAGECPMYPSCSEYSARAFRLYGPARGWAMTMERLMRCGRDEIRTAPRILVNGRVKFYDPVVPDDFPVSVTEALETDQEPAKNR